jgi:hypothetical protein
VSIEGLVNVPADVVVRVNLADGLEHSAILRSANNSFTIPEKVTRTELAVSYWKTGTIHILEGQDHLLFLLTLLLIVNGFIPLLLAGLNRLHSRSVLTLERAAPYAIGGIASFWTIERLVGTFG